MSEQARRTVISNARIFDPGEGVRTSSTVVIAGDRFAPGTELDDPATAVRQVDAGGLTMLPGLIDAHLHLLGISTYDIGAWLTEDPLLHAVRAVDHMRALSDAGFTTVRDAGSDVSIALKRAQHEGSIVGPRVWASGRWISVTGNLPDVPSVPHCIADHRGMGVSANGPDECSRRVREQVRNGADIIKIATTGGIDPSFVVADSTMRSEELAAIVDTAHGLGKKVTAHNNVLPGQPAVGARRAVEAGVDAIDHGYYLPDTILGLMAERGTYLIVTASYLKIVSEDGAEFGLSKVYVDKARIALEAVYDTVPRARAQGVPIAIGSDLLGTPLDRHGRNAMELGIARDLGMSDQEVLAMATCGNADLLGIASWTGKIAPGLTADLILVEGRPDEDVSILTQPEKIRYVMAGGVEMKNTLTHAGHTVHVSGDQQAIPQPAHAHGTPEGGTR
jgi:imidazolonepropionase-like amidohydrolase